jgi:predicted RNase H-like nuclease (RuvC/YqgF family)
MDDITQRVMRLENDFAHLDKTLSKLDTTMEKQVQSNLTLSHSIAELTREISRNSTENEQTFSRVNKKIDTMDTVINSLRDDYRETKTRLYAYGGVLTLIVAPAMALLVKHL